MKLQYDDFDDDSDIKEWTAAPMNTAANPTYGGSSGIFRTILPKNRKELILTITVGLLFIILIFSVTRKHTTATSEVTNDQICETAACVQIAATLTENMNPSVDPCEDFYEYACGGWIKKNPIPESYSRYSTFSQLSEKNRIIIQRILDTTEISNTTLKFSAMQKVLHTYKTCVDEDTIEQAGATPLKRLMADIALFTSTPKGALNLPIQNKKDIENFHDALVEITKMGTDAFISPYVGPDDKNSTHNVIQISQAGLTLPSRDYYVDKDLDTDETLVALKGHIARMMLIFTPTLNETDVLTRAQEIVRLEYNLAGIFAPRTELRNPDTAYHLLDLDKNFTNKEYILQVPTYLRKMINNPMLMPTEIILWDKANYLEELQFLLSTTPMSVIIDYLMWRVVKSFSYHLSSAFVDEDFAFSMMLYGIEARSLRSIVCMSRAASVGGFALGNLFVEEAFAGSSKETALQMVEDIRYTFESRLSTISWMDADGVDAAKIKAEAVEPKVGYPSDLIATEDVNEHYADLQIEPSSTYFENIVASIRYTVDKSIAKLGKTVDRSEWHMTPQTVNAYYSPSVNQIVFPAGILQPPFFHKDYLKALNYGGIGVVIGHELTHGFDDSGSKYDKDGNLHPWWSEETAAKFAERTQCLVDQYGSFEVKGETVNGRLTLGENIADNGGLTQAYHAYRRWVQETNDGEEEPRLPGFPNLSPSKLFFLSFSTVWCGAARDEEAHRQLLTDPHSPGRYRVIGALSNSKEFSSAFGCRASTMNPSNKCSVW